MVPRPDSFESFMLLLPYVLNSEVGGNNKVVLQFKFSCNVADTCYFTIKEGTIDTQRGTYESPDLTIETPFDVWMDIMTGKADCKQMLMERQFKVKGELTLMLQLFQREST